SVSRSRGLAQFCYLPQRLINARLPTRPAVPEMFDYVRVQTQRNQRFDRLGFLRSALTAGAAHDVWRSFDCRSHAREHPLVDRRIVTIGRRRPRDLGIFLVTYLRERSLGFAPRDLPLPTR